MVIDKTHVLSKRRIGHLGKSDVMLMLTKGGLNVVFSNGKVLGAAPHRAIAINLAQRQEPDLFIEELSKSEENLDFSMYQHLIPFWETFTKQLQTKLD